MSGYDALAAKVRAMYGKRLRMSDFEHISTLRSEAEVLEYLRTQPGWRPPLRTRSGRSMWPSAISSPGRINSCWHSR